MSDPGRSRGRARGRTREEAAEPARRPAEVAQRPGEPNLVAPVAVVTPQPGGAWSGRGNLREVQPDTAGRAAAREVSPMDSGTGLVGRASLSAGAAVNTPPAADRGGVGRGASRGREPREMAIFTRPAVDFDKRGKEGGQALCMANYFEVLKSPDWHLYQYRVDFVPDIDHIGVRKGLLRQHERTIGKYVFDGTLLYSATRLNEVTELVSNRISDNSMVKITLRNVGEIQKGDVMYIVVMNIIVRRCLGMLNLTMIKRDFFDPEAKTDLTLRMRDGDKRITIWPGYTTTIREHETNLLLNVEVQHKLLRGDTALEIMNQCRSMMGDWRGNTRAELEGKIVMTHYNKKTYRIDDIDFEMNPRSTFNLRKENRDVSYMEYYQTRYQLRINSDSQPLLVSRPSRRDQNRGDDQPIYLIPELCSMTGLTDSMRKDFNVMKEVGNITRVGPGDRVRSLLKFNKRLTDQPGVREELQNWRLQFSPRLVECKGRVIPPQKIIVQGSVFPAVGADWSRGIQGKGVAVSALLNTWILVYPAKMKGEVDSFVNLMRRSGSEQGFTMPNPIDVSLRGDRAGDYVEAIRNALQSNTCSLVLAAMASPRADVYSSIKKVTIADVGVPSQVVTGRILRSQENKLRSIATKVMLQVCAKLGGEPWQLDLPNQTWMVCGYDTYHDAKQKRAVGAFVASINKTFTRYFSSAAIHDNNEEISGSFYNHMIKALKCYVRVKREETGSIALPSKIFVYRDGVGAGDINKIKTIEVESIKKACMEAGRATGQENYNPGIAYIVVSKRINTRFFSGSEQRADNPPPGLVVDNTVTLYERFDFFLISQKVTQGTVSPTSYNIVEDSTKTSPDIHQRLAYALTHLYYNWSGTLRVPAPCQYAHKLAYLIGESITRVPHANLEKLPFYL